MKKTATIGFGILLLLAISRLWQAERRSPDGESVVACRRQSTSETEAPGSSLVSAYECPVEAGAGQVSEEENAVDEFDSLTDRWRELCARGVSMAEVEAFCRAFNQVPSARRVECVHRAANLIPDENFLLLAGILMDKRTDRAIAEVIFHDALNRHEDVKRPILRQIAGDKAHFCHGDAAWVLRAAEEGGG